MNYSYIRYSVLSLLFFSMVATTTCQTWSELFNQSYAQLDTLARSSVKTVQENNGVVAVKEFVSKNPVPTTICALAGAFALYRVVKAVARKSDKKVLVPLKKDTIQKRLYEALLNMHLENNNQKALSLYFSQLQKFAQELYPARFGHDTALGEIEIKLVELLNMMDDYINWSNHLNHNDFYEAMLIKYVELLSLLTGTNHQLIKTVNFYL